MMNYIFIIKKKEQELSLSRIIDNMQDDLSKYHQASGNAKICEKYNVTFKLSNADKNKTNIDLLNSNNGVLCFQTT